MKFLLIASLLTFAQPATADWYFEASLEGGAEFWTYTNEDGNVSPHRVKGNEIWVARMDAVNELEPDGACSFDNCTVTIYINGRLPRDREQVKVRFSNGKTMDFQFSAGGGSDVLLPECTITQRWSYIFDQIAANLRWIRVSFKLPISLVVFSFIGFIRRQYSVGRMRAFGVIVCQPFSDPRACLRARFKCVQVDTFVFQRLNRPQFAGDIFVQILCYFIKVVQVFIECLLCFLWRDVSDGAVQAFGVVPVHPFQGFPFDLAHTTVFAKTAYQ